MHLGHIIGPSDHPKRTAKIISDFNRRVNVFLSIFGFARVPVKYSLFKTYFMSLYSALLCDYSSKPIKSIFTAWRKAVRRLYRLPYKTHCDLLPLIVNDLPCEVL